MTDEELAAIEERVALCHPPTATELYNYEEQLMYQDVPTLVAEVRRLRALLAAAGLEDRPLEEDGDDWHLYEWAE